MVSNMSPEEYQELGRRYYKLKQYDKAVESFTQGIETSPTAGLYDHRAATYEKLEDFNAAVKDGREMIKMNKKDIRGYLRMASLLEKMKKPETALGIYKYGMKNVPVNDKNFKILQQLHDKLTRQLSPARAIDPFTILPVELAEMVLEYISFRHMVNCMRVSRGWRDYLSKIAKLWMHLDMSGARKPIPRSFVNMAYKRSQYRMIRVTVHRFEHMDVLKNLALAAKHLTELTLISLPHTMSSTLVDIAKSAPGLTKLIVHPNITADTVTQIMRARPALEHVAFHSVKYTSHSCEWVGGPFDKLNSVLLHCEHMTSTFILNLASLLGQTPSLQTLSLANMIHAADPLLILPTAESQLPRLTTLELQRIAMSQFPNLPPTLRHLTLELSPITDVSSGRLTLLRNHLPELTDLNFSGFELPAESLEQLLDLHLDESQTVRETTGAKPLVSLRICCPLHIEDENEGFFKGPGSVCGRSRRILTSALERLDMAGTCCDDDEIEQLLTYETSLTCIDLSRTKISGAAIKMLADKLPGLKSIKADECTKITGRDAIQYAERKGIRVSCQMNEKTGGRKVRYG